MALFGRPVQQAAAIVFRLEPEGISLCLIRRVTGGAWGIPKGRVDPGHTPEQTAHNETREEAGVRGHLLRQRVGKYSYDKLGETLTVAVYLLEFIEQQDSWEESRFRERRWAQFDEAARLLADHPVAPLLARARMLIASRGA